MDKLISQSKETSNKNTENSNDTIVQNINGVEISEINFPDEVFRDYVAKNFDKNSDGFLSRHEIEEALIVDVSFNKQITSLQGIEILSNLKRLVISYTKIKELDISHNTDLTYLDCSNTEIKELNLIHNIALRDLHCDHTKIKELDISHNTNLTYLDCSNTEIKELNLIHNISLRYLHCDHTKIKELDFTHNSGLNYLDCSDTDIMALNIISNRNLRSLHCENTKIKELDITFNGDLRYLSCNDIKIKDTNSYNSNLRGALTYLVYTKTDLKELGFDSNFETDKKLPLDGWENIKKQGLENCFLLQPGHLSVIGGRPRSGKTSMMLSIAQNVACYMNIPTLIISEEMNAEQLVHRLNLMKYGIKNSRSIPALSVLGWNKLTDEVLLNKKLHLIIDDRPGMRTRELQNKCKKYKKEYGIGLVIIDYLQLLAPDNKGASRAEEVTNITCALKYLAGDLGIPIILCSLLSRAAEYRGVPIVTDMGFCAKYTDEIMFILDNREDNQLNQEIIVIPKNGLLERIKLKWIPEYLKYINI